MWQPTHAGALTAEREDFARLLAAATTNRCQTCAEGAGRSRLGLAHIDAPVSVQVGREINLDTGKTAGFIACPGARATQAQPAASDEQSFSAIDIEALTCCPAAGTSGGLIFRFICISVTMRKHIGSDREGGAGMTNALRRQFSRRRMCSLKRVPSLDRSTVQNDRESCVASPLMNRWKTMPRWARISSSEDRRPPSQVPTGRQASPCDPKGPGCHVQPGAASPPADAPATMPSSVANQPRFAISSTSRTRADVVLAVLLMIVSCRHCDSDAVFRPSPNLPRSPAARAEDGPTPPRRMASASVARSMPLPSSSSATCG